MIVRLIDFIQNSYKKLTLPGQSRKPKSNMSKTATALALASCFIGGLSSAVAQISKDATSGQNGGVGTTNLSFTHVLGSGSNRLLVCGVQVANNSSVANVIPTVTVQDPVSGTSIPMAAIPASQAPTTAQSNASKIESEMFYLNDLSLGSLSGSVAVTAILPGTAPTGGVVANCASFFGVAQVAPEAIVAAYNGGNTSPLSASITTVTDGDLIVDSFAGGFNLGSTGKSASPIAGTPGTPSQTQLTIQTNQAGGIIAGSSYETTGPAGSYTVGWNYVASRGAYSVIAFAPAAPSSYTVTTGVNLVGAGTVSISPLQDSYASGTSITVTATAAANYIFTGFSGDLTGSTNPATLTVNNNKSITANFSPVGAMCALTTTSTGQGTVSPASGSYPCGTTINLSATAANGYGFTQWSGGGYSGTNSSASFTLTQDTTETATFNQTTTCSLTTSVVSGSGTITPGSGTYTCGTQLTLYALPAAQYVFGGWSGALSGSTTPITLTLNGNVTVSATFDQNSTNVTGDPRTVIEPVYPPVCSTLSAQQSASGLIEASPDTARVQAALNACASGQAVEFSSSGGNNAFIIAPITLPPGVTMLVDPDVAIFGSILSTDYSCNSSAGWCTPLINVLPNADPAPGSGIMGLGVIDGRGGVTLSDLGKSWWATGSDARPRLIYLGNNSTLAPADNFTLYKITLRNSPKFHVSGEGSNLTVWGIRIIAPPDSPNTDGIDPSGSKNITITNSYISDGDDMIAPKAGVGHVSNISIFNNHFYSGHGVSVGSETNAGLDNMFVHDNAFDNGFGGTSFDSLRIKSDSSRGGEVHDVWYKNTCINNGGDTFVFDPYYSSTTGNLIPNFHDITISNFHQLIRNSSYKSTIQGYNTNGIVYPVTLTMDNVVFDGAVNQNDWKAPGQVNNAQITLGPGPVSIATFLTVDASVSSNNVTLYNNISNSNAPFDCTSAFVYLSGDLTAPTAIATTGNTFTVTAVLQNVVSAPMSGTVAYPQQNMPTGTIQILEGTNVVASGAIANGSRLTGLTIPAMTSGTHVYTAKYLGDSNYPALTFGNFTVTTSDVAPAVANNQAMTVNYNTPTPIALTATGAGTLVYTIVTAPANGTLSGTAPTVTYTPASNFTGTDSFTFKVNNGGADSNIATITLTVVPSAPVANNQPVTVAYNTAAPITLAATGSGTLTYSVVAAPAHGTLSGTAPNLTYTPASNYSGTDSFTFKANNGTDSNVATISISVLPTAPVADSQSVTANYNASTLITLTASGSGTLAYTVVSNPTHGTLSGTAPNVSYTPTSGYSGADSFTFKANNGTDSNAATVNITVLPAAPVATGQSVTDAYNTPAAITLSATGGGTLVYTVASSPAHGTLTGTAPNVTYTPTSGYSGTDSFTFKANNGTDSNTATVSITVLPAAPVASGQPVTVAFNTATPVVLSATGNGTLVYTVVTSPAHGTLTGTAPNVTYTPISGYSGADSFTFKANNGTDSNAATVNITVLPAAPLAAGQSITVAFNTATPVTLSATGSGTLVYTVVTSPAHGTLTGTAPNLTYTPTSGYSGTDSFTFKANNGIDSNVATVSITVSAGFTWSAATGGSLSATVTAGQTATYNLQVAGWTGASGTIAFSCSGVPTLATCTVNPTSATLNGTAQIPVTVTVATQAVSAAVHRPAAPFSKSGKGVPFTVAAGMIGFIFGLRKRLKHLRNWGPLTACVALAALCFVAGCGGSSPPPDAAPGSYPLTITANAGGVTKTVSLTLTIQ